MSCHKWARRITPVTSIFSYSSSRSNLRAEFYNDTGNSPGVNNGTIDAPAPDRHHLDTANLGLFYDTFHIEEAAGGGYPDIDGSVVRFGDRSLNDGIGLIGTIHEIRIYNRQLTEDELASLANPPLARTVVLGSASRLPRETSATPRMGRSPDEVPRPGRRRGQGCWRAGPARLDGLPRLRRRCGDRLRHGDAVRA